MEEADELTRIVVGEGEEPEDGWPCVLTFRGGDEASDEKSYGCMFGKKAGSARLQRPPPTLAPPPRETRSDATNDKTRGLVREHAEELCATSPHKRDQKRRHVGPRLWISRSALILPMPVYALYALFDAKYPGVLKLAKFKEVFNQECWHAIHAYRGCTGSHQVHRVSSDTALAHRSSHAQAERAALTVGTALAHLLCASTVSPKSASCAHPGDEALVPSC